MTKQEAIEYLKKNFWPASEGTEIKTVAGSTTTDSWRQTIQGPLHLDSEPTLVNGSHDLGYKHNAIPKEVVDALGGADFDAEVSLIYQGRRKIHRGSLFIGHTNANNATPNMEYLHVNGDFQWWGGEMSITDEGHTTFYYSKVRQTASEPSRATPLYFNNLSDLCYVTDTGEGMGRQNTWPVTDEVAHIDKNLGYGINIPSSRKVGWRNATLINCGTLFWNPDHTRDDEYQNGCLYNGNIHCPVVKKDGVWSINKGSSFPLKVNADGTVSAGASVAHDGDCSSDKRIMNIRGFAKRFINKNNVMRFNYCWALVIYTTKVHSTTIGDKTYYLRSPDTIIYGPLRVLEPSEVESEDDYFVHYAYQTRDVTLTESAGSEGLGIYDYKVKLNFPDYTGTGTGIPLPYHHYKNNNLTSSDYKVYGYFKNYNDEMDWYPAQWVSNGYATFTQIKGNHQAPVIEIRLKPYEADKQ